MTDKKDQDPEVLLKLKETKKELVATRLRETRAKDALKAARRELASEKDARMAAEVMLRDASGHAPALANEEEEELVHVRLLEHDLRSGRVFRTYVIGEYKFVEGAQALAVPKPIAERLLAIRHNQPGEPLAFEAAEAPQE